MALGIDISNHQGTFDWAAAKAGGVKFAWVKATEGKTFVDKQLARNLSEARKYGIPVGAYHFARPDFGTADAEAEAAHFVKTLKANGGLKSGDLLPVLDLESTDGPKGASLSQWASKWMAAVQKALDVKAVFYSYPSFITSTMAGAFGLGDHILWLASYGPNDGQQHRAKPVGAWNVVDVHQYTSNGRIPGISGRLDLNQNFIPLSAITFRPATPTTYGPPWIAAVGARILGEGRLTNPIFVGKISKELRQGRRVTLSAKR